MSAQTKPVYSLYPTLLNSWRMYLQETGYDKDDEHIPFIPDVETMLERVNRVQKPQTAAQAEGVAFENAVLGRATPPTGPTERAVAEAQTYLPAHFFCDQWTMAAYDFGAYEVVIYGKIDLLGGGKVIDIKKTAYYNLGKFFNDHQLWYLQNLLDEGFSRMMFLINHDNHIRIEEYNAATVEWGILIDEVRSLVDFIEANRLFIYDQTIFTDVRKSNRKNLAFGYRERTKQVAAL